MWAANCELLGAELDGYIEANCRQALCQEQLIAPIGDVATHLAADFVGIGEDILGLTPRSDQLASSLLADAGNARDIVRRVAPQGKNIAYQYRILDTILLANVGCADNLHAVTLLLVEVAVFAHQLTVVLVGRNHKDFVAGLCTLECECSDYVVSLVVLDLKNGYTHSLEQALDIGHRLDDILGCGGAVGLVLGEDILAERSSLRVECHSEQVGLLALLDVAQELRKAEDYRGVHTRSVAHRATEKGVVVFEDQCVSIDQEEFFHSR